MNICYKCGRAITRNCERCDLDAEIAVTRRYLSQLREDLAENEARLARLEEEREALG